MANSLQNNKQVCSMQGMCVCVCVSCSAASDSLGPHGLWPTRLFCPWDSSGKSTEWVARSFSRGSSGPRGWTQISHIAGRFFTIWATKEAPSAEHVISKSKSSSWQPSSYSVHPWCVSTRKDSSSTMCSPKLAEFIKLLLCSGKWKQRTCEGLFCGFHGKLRARD